MPVGIFIAIGVAVLVVVAIIKLYRNTGAKTVLGIPDRCKICGRKTKTQYCPYCQTDKESLR